MLYTTAGGERGGRGYLNPPLPPLRGEEGFFSRVEERGGHWIVEEEEEDGRGCMSLAVVHKKGFFSSPLLFYGESCVVVVGTTQAT